MRRWVAVLAMAGAVVANGCGDGGSGGGDKAACQALADAKGQDAGIYTRLLKMDLSGEMRAAVTDLRDSTKGDVIQPDTFEKAGKVIGLCARHGVDLSG